MTPLELTSKRRTVLLGGIDTRLYSAVICPSKLSKDGKYIRLGSFYSDEVRGWYSLDEIASNIVSVINEFDDIPPETKKRWWQQ